MVSVPVPGARVPESPTAPLYVALPIPAVAPIEDATSLTLQLGTTPAVSSAGAGNTADALCTVHYAGTQFSSRITLP